MLIFTKIQGLLVRPVSVIFFSQFSSAYHSGSEKIRHLVEETSRLGFILSTLVFAGILACGDPMLRLLWEGDTFETGAIHQVYTTLCIVSVAMFLNAIALLYRKIVMTLGKIREQYLAYIAVQEPFSCCGTTSFWKPSFWCFCLIHFSCLLFLWS
jgi:O-antigen/teichoic acid export membrane protein